MMLSLTPLYRFLKGLTTYTNYNEDIYIGIKQISQYLIGNQYVSLDDSYTYVSREGKEMTLYLSNNKLMKKPGNEVLIYDIDHLQFEMADSYIYVTLTRDNKDYRFLIGYSIVEENSYEE